MALNPVADSVLAKQLEVAENENPDSQSSHITHGDEDEQSQSESITKEKSAVEKEQDGEVAPVEYVTGWKLVSIMVAVTSACFIMLLDMSIIVTAVPRITTAFHSLPDVGWYGSAYSLASAALQPLSGKLYTRFKIKWTFLIFLFIFEVGSLICGVAQSSKMLILGRAVAGIGCSGIQNGAFTMLSAAAPLHRQPFLMGIVMGGCQIGLVAGPIIGGALTEYASWRWCFYINLPIGAITALMIFFVAIPDRRQPSEPLTFRNIVPKLDLVGFALLAPASIMLLLALEYGGNTYPWKSATVIGLLVGGFIIAVIFMFWEARVGKDAMIPLEMIKKRQIWTACLTMLFLFVTVFVAAYYMPIYFQSIKNHSPVQSGIDLLPVMLSQLVCAVAVGAVIQRVGYYLPFAAVGAVVIAVGNGLLSTFHPDTPTIQWAAYQVIVGLGRGLAMQVSVVAIQANTIPSMTPIAMALLTFSQTFGGAVFLAIANAIFNNSLKDQLEMRVPGSNIQQIIKAGATGIRDLVSEEELPGVLMAYAKSVDAVFYLAIAASVCMFTTSWGLGWNDIRKKKQPATKV